ncbi:hypothetical protein C7T94_05625 [Pedobacter yulinensis]|uniref:Phosphatidate cytidylyltransferase n=1 Tax=Pedobacter yulinensis TaxID=2126353 RepID=A0A2T3HP29_9SPHI|nr:hypothetical protein [Pedobacter yulinensis]PST84204.1 hypothetical protein C7T94_05625 [Pedobacter yulinensis]
MASLKKFVPFSVLLLLLTTLSSCDLVQGIFKAGVWTGVILVVVVVALIIWLISRVFGGRR